MGIPIQNAKCPVKGQQCYACNGFNHFTALCQKKGCRQPRQKQQRGSKPSKHYSNHGRHTSCSPHRYCCHSSHSHSRTPSHSPSQPKVETRMPAEPCSAPTTPSTTSEELEVESPDSPDSQTSIASYTLCPRLPITYNEAALSQLQGIPQVTICNNLSIPFPSDSECSTDDTNGNTSSGDTSDSNGSPAEEVVADSSCLQRESPTAGTGTDMPTPQAVPRTTLQVHSMPISMRKMPSHRNSKIPIGIRSLQDHPAVLTRPSVPTSRTNIKSSGKLLPIPGPSSPTKGQPGPSTSVSQMPDRKPVLSETKSIGINSLQDHASCNSTFEPFQDHFGPSMHI